jgi:hypothetical protein
MGLNGSSKTAPRILFFSIVLGAEYLSYSRLRSSRDLLLRQGFFLFQQNITAMGPKFRTFKKKIEKKNFFEKKF